MMEMRPCGPCADQPSPRDEDIGVYFTECLRLIARYQWIYDFQLTHFITHRVWRNIPEEWLPVMSSLTTDELNGIPFGHVKDTWPDSLKQFLQTAVSLTLPRTLPGHTSPVTIDHQMARGMSPKKQHEVCHLAGFVSDVCMRSRCSGIVDVGSGLGYLSLLLNHQMGYRVLGVECEESRCRGAQVRTDKLVQDKLSNFHSQALCLTDEPGSREEFRQLIQEHFNQGTMCNKCIPGDPGTNSDHESPGDPGTNSDHESPGDPGTNSDHESPGDPGTNNDHESPGDPGTNSDHESPGDPGTNSDHESPGDPGTNSDHESPGDPGTNSDHESPGDPGTNKETSVDQCTNHVNKTPVDLGTVCAPKHCQLKNNRSKEKSKGMCSTEAGSHGDNAREAGSHGDNAREASSHGDDARGVCLIGLHCCGDLTPTMLRLFSQTRELRSLVCLSCCYHCMAKTDSDNYAQFPMSDRLTQAMMDIAGDFPDWSLSTYGLRLAAQETKSRWRSQTEEDHRYHENNVVFRGILDVIMETEGIMMLKDKRKLVAKQQCTDFKSYIEKVLSRVTLNDDVDRDSLKQKLLQAYSDHSDIFCLVEPFTGLQVVLQGVIETLILRDRVQYLHERGLEAQLVPVMDDNISPRNMAIIAWKTNPDTDTVDHRRSDTVDHRRSDTVDHHCTDTVDHRRTDTVDHHCTDTVDHHCTDTVDHHCTDTVDHRRTDTVDLHCTDTVDHQRTDTVDYQHGNCV